jgi:leucyl-tRNA synthetase
MQEMDEKYFPEKIEEKWQKLWDESGVFHADDEDTAREKFYCLEMLPYPSGFLHMGHVRNYSIGDALAWYKRLNNFNVLHPIGWDSFGQPAEQAAIKRQINPRVWTEENINHMRRQFKRLGISFDWQREIAAHTPEYYKWDQWFFLKMYERGLIYRRESPVNWCPNEETVLSNEQSSGGVCWRCGAVVEKRNLEQWFIRTTLYAEQLLDDMREIEAGWPERVLTMQRNWINRSVGAYVDFAIKDSVQKIRVFTTRLDTIFGATALVLAPEHPLLAEALKDSALRKDVERFAERVRALRASANIGEDVPKEGMNTGLVAINPFNDELLPVWVANYVFVDYGAGAVMSVPAHDERDFEFAQKYSLPVHRVIERISYQQEQIVHDPDAGLDQSAVMPHAFTDYGLLVNSGEWSGKLSVDAINEMALYAEEKKFGGGAVTYRLRDWGISRQRFWGAPIPIIYCRQCGVVPVPEKDLPVVLPERAEFTGTGQSPLAGVAEFVNTTCPKCGEPARRETDTMDTFVDSSWYFFRYCDPHNEAAPFSKERAARWMPVDQYIGGIEHAVLHLLYMRFWTKMMRDIGIIKFDEPVRNLLTQGMVTNIVEDTNEWKAMSKSLGNGVDPDEMIAAYGADAVRLFVMFAVPPENELRWLETGIEGAVRFLRRINNMIWRWRETLMNAPRESSEIEAEFSSEAIALRRRTHQTIARVTNDFEELHFNTSIAALMELVNALTDFKVEPTQASKADAFAVREALEALVLMLAPFAPHVAEEMWEALDHAGGILRNEDGAARWPRADPQLARKEELEIPVQVNGKLRGRISATPQTSEEELREAALTDERVRGWTNGRDIVKVIVVPQRLVNIVVR